MRLPVLRSIVLPRIIGALLPLLLCACSAMQTGYNNAPTLLYWWLDGYVDFDDAQTTTLRTSLDTLHAWHRREEMPAYAELLSRLRQQATGPVTPQALCAHVPSVRLHLQRLGEHSAEGLARVAPALQAEQLRHLARQFDKHNRKWREEWLDGTPAERLERRLDRAVDRLESFYGRLGAAQTALLRQHLAESRFDAQLAWTERLRRQQDILRVLDEQRERDDPAQVQAAMQALVQRILTSPDPAAHAQFERMFQESCQTLAALHNSASPAQRRRLAERLQDYEADLRALAAQT